MIKNKICFLLIILAVIILASIRAFEAKIFYDPFIAFYKSEYFHKPLPTFDAVKMFLNLVLRYSLNSALSLFIIYKLFVDKGILKVAAYLYLFIGLVLIFSFYIYLNSSNVDYMILFYIRRFLIQPVLLVLFIPAFYYQKKQNKSLT